MTLMTWGEFKRAVEAAGVLDETPLDAVDTYSPQVGEKLAIGVEGGTALIQTKDVERGDETRWVYCSSCRAVAGPDSRPDLVRQRRERRGWRGILRAIGAS